MIETNSYYTSNPKVERPPREVVQAPAAIPVQHVFNDRDAQAKMDKIDHTKKVLMARGQKKR